MAILLLCCAEGGCWRRTKSHGQPPSLGGNYGVSVTSHVHESLLDRGLFLLVTPNGGRWWRLKYRFGGKEKLLSLGTYPEVSLKAAREKRDDCVRVVRSL
ncbi:MAG: DUF4102 domain-containing protein [Gammaproteobacteria bacterium]|nr:DUF4102 domain-containing protein [Gammaproteobacteria bacterium]